MIEFNGNFSYLEGKILKRVINNNNEEIIFETIEGEILKLLHFQDCCESVYVEDVNGDFADLLNAPILIAEERSSQEESSDYGDSTTWSFYTIRTIKGSVDIRWCGTSNGYYSESVDFIKEK